MAHEISGDANTPSNKAAQDFSALADQWFDKNWYLPPEGDQTWREREARRLFGDGKDAAVEEDLSVIEQPDQPVNETAAPYESGLRRARNVILPISLAACVLLFGAAIFVSKILTPGIWGPHEPKAISAAPAQLMTQVATEENARLRPAYEGGTNHVTYNDVSQALPQPIGEAALPVDQDIALPLPRPAIAVKQEQPVSKPAVRTAKVVPVTTNQDPPVSKPVVRAAKAQPLQTVRSKARAAKSLPPIGEAYFASHAPAGAAGNRLPVSARPIGQGYFEKRAPVAD